MERAIWYSHEGLNFNLVPNISWSALKLTEVPRFDTPATYLMSTTCSAFKWGLLIGFGALVLYALARSED